jgi:polyisoprenyl-teichoic acid--peptidoglycan teichoic acid transferase
MRLQHLTVAGRPVTRRAAVATLALALAGVIAVGALLAYSLRPSSSPPIAAVPSPSPTEAPPSPSPTPDPTSTPSASPEPSATPRQRDPLLGKDGRLTVLLLGSDYRPAHPGNRTDTIMIVSVDPTTGRVSAASIPRDTVGFPLGDGRTYGAKVNGLYQSLISDVGRGKAGRQLKGFVGDAIGVEVDSYAVVGFEGVRQLVNAVGGVDVVLEDGYRDPYFWVTSKQRGVYFPAGRNHLDGNTALVFARSRKGDNDFGRARRQQLLVGAAVDAVRRKGLPVLPKLVSLADRWVRTDIPMQSVPRLYEIVSKADVAGAERVVWGPRTWADSVGGSSFTLNIPRIRQWTAEYMAPIAPTG